jgi:class 3 adenylate cyclase
MIGMTRDDRLRRTISDARGKVFHLDQVSAQPGRVLVSSTVKDLVAGSGRPFEDLGQRMLKGVPDPWRLLGVARA